MRVCVCVCVCVCMCVCVCLWYLTVGIFFNLWDAYTRSSCDYVVLCGQIHTQAQALGQRARSVGLQYTGLYEQMNLGNVISHILNIYICALVVFQKWHTIAQILAKVNNTYYWFWLGVNVFNRSSAGKQMVEKYYLSVPLSLWLLYGLCYLQYWERFLSLSL